MRLHQYFEQVRIKKDFIYNFNGHAYKIEKNTLGKIVGKKYWDGVILIPAIFGSKSYSLYINMKNIKNEIIEYF